LLDFSTIISGSSGAIVLFLEAKLVFQEELVVRGVYHAVKDQFEHGITVSDNPAVNVLMHIFGTNQIEIIKQEIVPSSFHEPRVENNGVAMILISNPDKDSSFAEVLSEFREHFSYDLLHTPVIPATLDAVVVRTWMLHKEPPFGSPSQANLEAELLARTAVARMALFSLNLQQKN
jgi:hypothetical protein